MAGLVKDIFRRGSKKIKKNPALAVMMIEQCVKYSKSRNLKYESLLLKLRQELVQTKLRNLINLFNQRDPDELEIIDLINNIQSIETDNQEFIERKLEFAEKLHSYAKYYVSDDHRRALKIIIKVLELHPSMKVATEDFNKLLKIESKYLVSEAKKLIGNPERFLWEQV